MAKRAGLLCERTALRNGMAFYDCASYDELGNIATTYESYIDLHTGAVHCDCPSFKYKKKEGVIPDVGTPKYHCLHLDRIIADCIERGDIEIQIPT